MGRESRKRLNLTALAEAAFQQASRKVIELARQTNTPVVVWKDGHILEIPSDQAEAALLRGQSQDQKF
jgi:DNA polymerase III alpha subunit (gram-positive type)